jgi:competence protein ComEA
MTRRALAAAALLALSPTAIRRVAAAWPSPAACVPEGRGTPPRHWVGCAGDEGPARDLDGPERLAHGQPVDLNRADARDLAGVPGIGARLAEAVVADREERGPFRTADDLVRVRGVGPARLARARPHLVAGSLAAE